MNDLPPIARRVRERRQELGLTQDEVSLRAKRAGEDISANGVRYIEQGKSHNPQARTRRALAAALDVSLATVDDWVQGDQPDTTWADWLAGFRKWAALNLRPHRRREQAVRALQDMLDVIDEIPDDDRDPYDELLVLLNGSTFTDEQKQAIAEGLRRAVGESEAI